MRVIRLLFQRAVHGKKELLGGIRFVEEPGGAHVLEEHFLVVVALGLGVSPSIGLVVVVW